jgi:oligopeptide transport system substrate-binding protein
VARSWQVLEGGRKFIFHLRDDVQWSDGRPVTAGDFAYAWKRVLDPVEGSPVANMLHDVKGAKAYHQGTADEIGVQVIDDVTLAVELEAPTGYFLQLLTNTVCFPVPRHTVEAHGEAWDQVGNIVTNGPFVLDAWQRGESMVFSRNPAYHGPFTGNLERVELVLNVTDPYARGDMDIADVPPPVADDARQRFSGAYISFPRPQIEVVGFDVTRPPFDDPRVRQAFAMSIDKETLADGVLKGDASPARGGFVPPGVAGHSAEIGLPYDPVQARRLLAQAGYPGGRGFPGVKLVTRTINRLRVEYLQTQWRENLGVEIAWEMMRLQALFDKLRSKPPRIFLVAWVADYLDPDNFLRVGDSWQHTRWQNDTFDRLVEEARRVMDQEERMRRYRQADKILIEEAAIVPLYYRRTHLLVKPWVSKLSMLMIGGLQWKDVVIEPH